MSDERIDRTIARGDVFAVLPELPDNHGAAAVLDYPWQFDASNGTGRMSEDSETGTIESLPYDLADHDYLSVVLYELARKVKDGGWVFVFADDDCYPEFRQRVEDSDLTYRRTLIWDKEHFGMGYYHRVQHLFVIAATVGETGRYVQDRGTVFEAARHSASGPDWPTAKPVGLYEQLTRSPVLKPGERLLEPFCGTAPGCIAAVRNCAAYWGCDLASKPIEIARARTADTTFDVADQTDAEPETDPRQGSA